MVQRMNSLLPEESLRWFGPEDPVPLAYIRQAGATAVFTALHQIPYGELWPREAILRRRKERIAAKPGLLLETSSNRFPVHEEIKTGQWATCSVFFKNYTDSLRNVAAEGLTTVICNFMPVLDWIRTDMQYTLPDGSRCMHYDPVKFSAFELFALNRPGARADYSSEQVDRADNWWRSLDHAARDAFVQNIIDVFPGQKWGLSLDQIRAMLARYDNLTHGDLESNLARFLEAVIPVAEEVGINLAIHPDGSALPLSLASPRRRMSPPRPQIARLPAAR